MWNVFLPLLSLGLNLMQTGAQQKVEKKHKKEVKEQKNVTAGWDLTSLMEQARQASDTSNLEQFERQKQALRERGKIAVASGEANVGGNSVLRQTANSFLDEAFDSGIMEENLKNTLGQNALQGVKVLSNAGLTVGEYENQRNNIWNVRTHLGLR